MMFAPSPDKDRGTPPCLSINRCGHGSGQGGRHLWCLGPTSLLLRSEPESILRQVIAFLAGMRVPSLEGFTTFPGEGSCRPLLGGSAPCQSLPLRGIVIGVLPPTSTEDAPCCNASTSPPAVLSPVTAPLVCGW